MSFVRRSQRQPLRLFGLILLLTCSFMLGWYALLNRVMISVFTRLHDNPPVLSDSAWKEIFKDFYIYSIYPTVGSSDTKELHVTITASNTDRNFWAYTVCHCIYHSNDALLLTTDGILEKLPEGYRGEGQNMVAGRGRCPFPKKVQRPGLVSFQCKYGKLSGGVTFPIPTVFKQPPKKMSFAHCASPIWGRFDEPASLMEFIEYHRLMGISKFFWYDMDVSSRTMDVLRYYSKNGILDLSNWRLPWCNGKSIHNFGQVAALYDCAMKTSQIFDYTVVSDLDEYFATTKEPASFNLIVNGGSTDCAIVRSVFMDPNANYTDMFDPQSGKPILKTTTITQRTTLIYPPDNRSKYICRMRHVDVPMIHTVQKTRGSPVFDRPNPETSILLHFRPFHSYKTKKGLNSITNETRSTANAVKLQKRFSEVWEAIFG